MADLLAVHLVWKDLSLVRQVFFCGMQWVESAPKGKK